MAKKNPTDPEQTVEQEVEQPVQEPEEVEQDDDVEAAVEEMIASSGYGQALRKLADATDVARRKPVMLQASDFEPVALPLGSGIVVEVRPTDLQSLIISGLIPEPLLASAIKAAEGHYDIRLTDDETIGMSLDQIREEEVKQTRRMIETLNIMTAAVVVNPRIVATLDELKQAQEGNEQGVVWAGWLHRSDKIQILQYAQAPVVAFRAFRTE
jgi:hypothetical protein